MSTDIYSELIDMETIERIAPVIRNAAHPLRLRILDFLRLSGRPRTVNEIVDACGVCQVVASQAIVSHQLRILKDQGILSAQRSGNFVFYTIINQNVLLLLDCIRQHGSCQNGAETGPDHQMLNETHLNSASGGNAPTS